VLAGCECLLTESWEQRERVLAIDRGLVRHRYAKLLHARGNRGEAVDYLREAHELFASVGAEPYRQAVADDLASCGIRTATRQSPLDLTEREQDLVALVRKGMTNKEIAAEMYVSEKAVEYHLRNVTASSASARAVSSARWTEQGARRGLGGVECGGVAGDARQDQRPLDQGDHRKSGLVCVRGRPAVNA